VGLVLKIWIIFTSVEFVNVNLVQMCTSEQGTTI
jgi:hypothetical protein